MSKLVLLLLLLALMPIITGCTDAVYAGESVTPVPEPATPTPEAPGTIPPLPPFVPRVAPVYLPAVFGAAPCDDMAWGDWCGVWR